MHHHINVAHSLVDRIDITPFSFCIFQLITSPQSGTNPQKQLPPRI